MYSSIRSSLLSADSESAGEGANFSELRVLFFSKYEKKQRLANDSEYDYFSQRVYCK